MGILIFIIIVFIIIVIIVKPKNHMPKKGSLQETRIKLEYYQDIDNITTKCFDEKTTEFNRDLYFENRDIYRLSCPYPEIIEYMEDNLRYIGRSQIDVLNLILDDTNFDRVLFELRKRENIIRNVTWACGGGEGKNCPQYIQVYRKKVVWPYAWRNTMYKRKYRKNSNRL